MPQFLGIDGKPLHEAITGLGRTSIVVRRGNKAIKILRRIDTSNMTERQRLIEEDTTELNRQSIANEILMYQHLGYHHGVLDVKISDEGIEMAYLVHGTLQKYLQEHRVDWTQKLHWIQAAANTIQFVHTKGVIHGDISTMNFLVGHDLSLQLSDFGESVRIETEVAFARANGLSKKTDIFHFGSVIFEIVTEQRYWFDAREDEDEEGEQEGIENQTNHQWPEDNELPHTEGILLGEVIERCWAREGFQRMTEVCESLGVGVETDGCRALELIV